MLQMKIKLQSLSDQSTSFNRLCKIAFLSYHIAIYKSNIDSIDCEDKEIALDEIYDYLQDLKRELNVEIPDIEKSDISLCFHILNTVGICQCSE